MLMLLPFFALQAATPKTFDELELANTEAYIGLEHFRCEFIYAAPGDDGKPQDVRVVTLRDGDRHRNKMIFPGDNIVECFTDGTTHWNIFHPQKAYAENKWEKKKLVAKEQLAQAEEGKFNLSLVNEVGCLLFAANPVPVLDAITTVNEDGKSYRKAVITATSKEGRKATITEWFLPDKWILCKFLMEGQAEQGTMKISGEAKVLELDAKFESTDFILDSASVVGYQKISGGLYSRNVPFTLSVKR